MAKALSRKSQKVKEKTNVGRPSRSVVGLAMVVDLVGSTRLAWPISWQERPSQLGPLPLSFTIWDTITLQWIQNSPHMTNKIIQNVPSKEEERHQVYPLAGTLMPIRRFFHLQTKTLLLHKMIPRFLLCYLSPRRQKLAFKLHENCKQNQYEYFASIW